MLAANNDAPRLPLTFFRLRCAQRRLAARCSLQGPGPPLHGPRPALAAMSWIQS